MDRHPNRIRRVAASRPAPAEFAGKKLRPRFRSVAANRMAKLMGNREIQQFLPRRTEFPNQLGGADRVHIEKRFIEKCLAVQKRGHRRRREIDPQFCAEGLPFRARDEDPLPRSQAFRVVLLEQAVQPLEIADALGRFVFHRAGEVLVAGAELFEHRKMENLRRSRNYRNQGRHQHGKHRDPQREVSPEDLSHLSDEFHSCPLPWLFSSVLPPDVGSHRPEPASDG